MLEYQVKESAFFGKVATVLLKGVLEKYNIAQHIHACMKTTVSVHKQHYLDVCEELGNSKINLVSANCYDVVDIFHRDLQETGDKAHFGQRVASYMKGWWGDVLEGGLLQQGVDRETVKKASREFFDELLPSFVTDNIDIYPEYYNTLALKL